MEITAWTRTKPAATDLSRAPGFTLGPLSVDPPARRIANGTRSQMVEPRVMRVLVALGETPGRVLSRDDLIELCWDGQVVGDSAITRVVSMLRHALNDLGDGKVHIETITKVGFRLLVDGQTPAAEAVMDSGMPVGDAPAAQPDPAPAMPFWRRKWTRRAAIGGIVATGAVGAALAYGFREQLELRFTDAGAAELYRRGQEIQMTGEPGTVRRAMDFYKRAVTIDPNYAPAWAALALSYRHPTQGPPNMAESRTSQPHLIQTAADRALKLDPGNVDARLARIAIYPSFHHWLDQEAQFREVLRQFPNSATGNSFLGLLLTEVGRLQDALAFVRRAVEIDPTRVIAWGQLSILLTNSGQDEEAQKVLDQASSRWPRHNFLWIVRYMSLVSAKRYKEAAAFVRDPDGMPELMGKEGVDLLAGIADALAAGKADESTAKELICLACNGVENAPLVVPLLAQCGAATEAFDMLQAYYFGGKFNGVHFAPPGVADPRVTFMLFGRAMIAVNGDPRFGSLLERTGLEQYWRKTGIQPDFRRR